MARSSATTRLKNRSIPYTLYFNGLNNSSKLSTPVVPSTTGWCIAMWIKPGDKGTPTHSYASYNSAGFTNGFFIYKQAGYGTVSVNVYNSTTTIYTDSVPATTGDWLHLAISYLPNGSCKIYKNGTLIQTKTSTGTMGVASSQTLTFANRSYVNNATQVNFSNIIFQNTTTPWTDEQVSNIYQNDTVPSGATMVLPLNEGTGTTATDTSGNGNNGTLTLPNWITDAPTATRSTSTTPRRSVENLVFNGDFEYAPSFTAAQTASQKWIDGTAAGSVGYSGYGWANLSITGTASAQFDNTVSKVGNNSLKISTGATSSVISAANMRIDSSSGFKLENIIRVQPSTSYTLTYWMKTNLVSGTADDGAQIRLSRYDSTGTFIAILQANTPVKTTTDWTQYTYTFTTTSTTNFITVRPVIVGNTGTGTLIMDAWFDDIRLTKTTPDTRTAA